MSQNAFHFDSGKGKRSALNYLLYVPHRYAETPEGKWPLILFLHGANERGEDIELVKRHGPPKIVEKQRNFPFVVVSPQCPARSGWQHYLRTLKDLLTSVIESYRVDANRVYLTGLSMGGYGTWHLASRYPERFAAIAPICGGGLRSYGFPDGVCHLKTVPVWAFHGARDTIVPVEESEAMVEALTGCGGDVRLTIYPDLEHDSWTRTYKNPELYEWFLSHSLDREPKIEDWAERSA